MSEKALWNWLNSKLKECGGKVSAARLENCSLKGVPDTVLAINHVCGFKIVRFIELKDWSVKKRHPLLVEQKNFLDDFGGLVLIKTSKKDLYLLHTADDLWPLTTGDVDYAISNGRWFPIPDFNANEFLRYVGSL